jgi:cytoskeletal protein CcmA (bactofilin family)
MTNGESTMSNTIRPANKVTVVEEGTEFRGTLTSSCPIDVRGRIEGELKTPSLTVSASGAVHGRTTVGEMRSLGEISGEFDADKIELAGVVRDNTVIRARSLDVKIASERGKLQIIFGECELSVGDEPRETDHADEAAAAAAAVAVAPAPVMEAPPAPAAEMPIEPAPAMMSAEPAAPAPEAHEADDEAEEDGESMSASTGGKRKRKRKNGHEEPATGWSQPPSQPPPAN